MFNMLHNSPIFEITFRTVVESRDYSLRLYVVEFLRRIFPDMELTTQVTGFADSIKKVCFPTSQDIHESYIYYLMKIDLTKRLSALDWIHLTAMQMLGRSYSSQQGFLIFAQLSKHALIIWCLKRNRAGKQSGPLEIALKELKNMNIAQEKLTVRLRLSTDPAAITCSASSLSQVWHHFEISLTLNEKALFKSLMTKLHSYLPSEQRHESNEPYSSKSGSCTDWTETDRVCISTEIICQRRQESTSVLRSTIRPTFFTSQSSDGNSPNKFHVNSSPFNTKKEDHYLNSQESVAIQSDEDINVPDTFSNAACLKILNSGLTSNETGKRSSKRGRMLREELVSFSRRERASRREQVREQARLFNEHKRLWKMNKCRNVEMCDKDLGVETASEAYLEVKATQDEPTDSPIESSTFDPTEAILCCSSQYSSESIVLCTQTSESCYEKGASLPVVIIDAAESDEISLDLSNSFIAVDSNSRTPGSKQNPIMLENNTPKIQGNELDSLHVKKNSGCQLKRSMENENISSVPNGSRRIGKAGYKIIPKV